MTVQFDEVLTRARPLTPRERARLIATLAFGMPRSAGTDPRDWRGHYQSRHHGAGSSQRYQPHLS